MYLNKIYFSWSFQGSEKQGFNFCFHFLYFAKILQMWAALISLLFKFGIIDSYEIFCSYSFTHLFRIISKIYLLLRVPMPLHQILYFALKRNGNNFKTKSKQVFVSWSLMTAYAGLYHILYKFIKYFISFANWLLANDLFMKKARSRKVAAASSADCIENNSMAWWEHWRLECELFAYQKLRNKTNSTKAAKSWQDA